MARRPILRWRFGESVAPLAAVLKQGGVLAIPTESSYGLAVDPRSAAGVEAIYRLKGRERGKALPVVAADRRQIEELGIKVDLPAIQPAMSALLGLWPAPLSCVLPLGSQAPPIPAAAGGGTLAVRIPDHAGLRGLLSALGTALTATSANASGDPPLLHPDAVAELLAGSDLAPECLALVDGGTLKGGPPSTLIRMLQRGGAGTAAPGVAFELLRPGSFSAESLFAGMNEDDG